MDFDPATSVARLRQTLLDASIPRDDRFTAVLQAMKKIPIAKFEDPNSKFLLDQKGVAFMSVLLRARKEEPVLQIGFGTGYETAILARISRAAHVIEPDPQQARLVAARLLGLGIGNVRCWDAGGPGPEADSVRYATVFVTDPVPEWPRGAADFLKVGGRLITRIVGEGRLPHYALVQKRRTGSLHLACFSMETLRRVGMPSR